MMPDRENFNRRNTPEKSGIMHGKVGVSYNGRIRTRIL